MDLRILVIVTIQLWVGLIVSCQNWKDPGAGDQFRRWAGSSTSTAAKDSLTAVAFPMTDKVLRCVIENYEYFIFLLYT